MRNFITDFVNMCILAIFKKYTMLEVSCDIKLIL